MLAVSPCSHTTLPSAGSACYILFFPVICWIQSHAGHALGAGNQPRPTVAPSQATLQFCVFFVSFMVVQVTGTQAQPRSAHGDLLLNCRVKGFPHNGQSLLKLHASSPQSSRSVVEVVGPLLAPVADQMLRGQPFRFQGQSIWRLTFCQTICRTKIFKQKKKKKKCSWASGSKLTPRPK